METLRRPQALVPSLTVLGAALMAVALVAVATGPMRLTWLEVWRSVWQGPGDEALHSTVVWSIRLPRVALAAVVGAGLASSGALLQGIFRNPLADPSLIGVSSGAALGAGVWMVSGGVAALGAAGLPIAAFGGAMAATALVFRLGRVHGQTHAATLLLAGVAINAAAGAGLGLCQALSDDATLRSLTFWMLGSLGEASGGLLLWVAAPALLPVLVGPWLARALDALQLGEVPARHMGVRVERLQAVAVVLSAISVGTAVAACGIIGFVGLVVPHLARLLFGPAHRAVLPVSALLGALLLVGADALARVVVAPGELPIGVVTSLLGVPSFMVLLRRARGLGQRGLA